MDRIKEIKIGLLDDMIEEINNSPLLKSEERNVAKVYLNTLISYLLEWKIKVLKE